jgi:trehalose 6-phosphate synthase
MICASESAEDVVVVANRLPVEMLADGRLVRSPGGLVSALSSMPGSETSAPQWVGWLGPQSSDDSCDRLADDSLHAVPLRPAEVAGHYRGFCNSLLWPLFHGRLQKLELNRSWWRHYRAVNQRFATTVADIAPPNGIVWVHDYHLLLVPAMLRARRSDLRIGLFLHIPFPPAQLFAALPWRQELLLGMLGADLLGFQTDTDVANLYETLDRFGGGQVRRHGPAHRPAVAAEAFPISIDFAHWSELGTSVAARGRERRAELDADYVFIGADRLDYTKGISQRLTAFGELLDEGHLDPERTTFVQIAVPSRDDIPSYRKERDEIERLVDEINAHHVRRAGDGPIRYIHEGLEEEDLAVWFCASDCLVVTSLADGMNLVAKEFVACRADRRATVVLSEFAGAAANLPGAMVVNPYDTEAVKRSLLDASRMPVVEQVERMVSMREQVHEHDFDDWAYRFLGRLRTVGTRNSPRRRSVTARVRDRREVRRGDRSADRKPAPVEDEQ